MKNPRFSPCYRRCFCFTPALRGLSARRSIGAPTEPVKQRQSAPGARTDHCARSTALDATGPSPVIVESSLGKLTLGAATPRLLSVEFQSPAERHHQLPRLRQPPQQLHHRQRRDRCPIRKSGVTARLALQIGHTPNTYYLAEPVSRADLSTSVVGSRRRKHLEIHPASADWLQSPARSRPADSGRRVPVPDWPGVARRQRQLDLFAFQPVFNLPFYHTGVRLTQQLSEAWARPSVSSTAGTLSSTTTVKRRRIFTCILNPPSRSAPVFGAVLYRRRKKPARCDALVATPVRCVEHALFCNRFAFSLHMNVGEPEQDNTASWIAGATTMRVELCAG